MEARKVELANSTWSVVAATLVVVGAALFWPHLLQKAKLRQFPLVAEDQKRSKRVRDYFFSAASVYQEGYQQFKDRVYRLTTLSGSSHSLVTVFEVTDWGVGDHIIIPERYLDEVRQLPDDTIDVLHTFKDVCYPSHVLNSHTLIS